MAIPRSMCSKKLQQFFRRSSSWSILRIKNIHSSFFKNSSLSSLVLVSDENSSLNRYYSINSSISKSKNQKSDTDSITNQVLQQKKLEAEKDSKDESKEKSNKKEGKWTGKNMWKWGLVGMTAAGIITSGCLIYEWGSPRQDEDGKQIEDEFSSLPFWKQYPLRTMREFNFYKQMIRDPSSEKLLPDPLKEPYYQPPYTLVLEMTGVLVHPDWTAGTGWRFKKRPGIDYFLQQVGPPLFEVVIYTSEPGFTASAVIDNLDPQGYIAYRLFRDATRYTDGHHKKDLECLNRDLAKVIHVDCDAKSFSINPKNALGLKTWNGEDSDRSLFALANFLRAIAASGVDDVRPILEYYSQFDDPLEAFLENQRKLADEQEKISKMQEEEQKKRGVLSSYGSSFFGRRR